MSVALMGFLTGLAKGSTERIKKEREDNEALIENRLKMAATNKLRREKEREAQRALLNERYSTISSYLPADATEEQKLALVSNEAIAKEYVTKRSAGEDIDLNKFLVVNKEKVPQGFKTTRQYLDSLTAAPEPVSQEQMQQAFGEQRGFLGARTGVSAGRAEKMAQQFGGTAGELLAYEKPMEPMQMPEIARMNVEMLKDPKRKTPQQRLDDYQNAYIDAVEQYGADSPESKAMQTEAITLRDRIKALEPKQETFTSMLDAAKVTMANARPGTPEYAAAEREVNRLVNIGKKDKDNVPTLPQTRSLFAGTATQAVTAEFGNLVGKGIVIETSLDGTPTYKYTGGDKNEAAKIKAVGLNAIKRQYSTMSDAQGRPLNEDIRRALIEFGVEFNQNGVPIFQQAASAATPTPTPPPAAGVGAQRTQVPAAASGAPVNIEQERKAAEDIIARGADRASVAQRFKQRTGQDL
jgi:hypothetical protein